MRTVKSKLTLRKEPNQQRAHETMETIIRATAHILEKDGFEKASTNKIAAKAGVSIGSLYQYFPTKESILSLMMEKYMRGQLESIEKTLIESKSKNLKETIRSLIYAVLEGKNKNKRFTKIFAQKLMGFNRVDILQKMDKQVMELFRVHLKQFDSELRQENLELALYMINQCVRIIPVALMFQDEYEIDDPRVLDEMVHLAYQFLKKEE